MTKDVNNQYDDGHEGNPGMIFVYAAFALSGAIIGSFFTWIVMV